MPLLPSSTSSAARTALVYVTLGALLVIWTAVWYVYLTNNPPQTNGPYYWCAGLLVSGLTLIGIGLGLGRIGQQARAADIVHSQVVATPPVAGEVNGVPATVVPTAPAPPAAGTAAAPAVAPAPTSNTPASDTAASSRPPTVGSTH